MNQYSYKVKEEERMNPKAKKSLIVAIVATAVLFMFVISVNVANVVGPNYQYEKTVHSHMVNAWAASTPELMENQIALAIQGMKQLGLTEDMYGKLMPWQQTPEWRMDYQYLHLQAIIDRCHEVIDWRNHQDLSNGQVTDVYNQKMNNLRSFIVEGGYSDYIAQSAFYVNLHPFYYVWWGAISAAIFVFVGLAWTKTGIIFSAQSEESVDAIWFYVVWILATIIIVIGAFFVVMGM